MDDRERDNYERKKFMNASKMKRVISSSNRICKILFKKMSIKI